MIYEGEYLRNARKARKLTISELAFRTGVSYHTLGNLERQIISPTKDTNKMISDYLELGIDNWGQILTRSEQPYIAPKSFKPFLTEDEMIAAKPLLDNDTGLTVGDVVSDEKRLMKLIYK
jgi:transcriptional regulator with XRE-family HTH domain